MRVETTRAQIVQSLSKSILRLRMGRRKCVTLGTGRRRANGRYTSSARWAVGTADGERVNWWVGIPSLVSVCRMSLGT